jgi:hypothetical protein
MTEDAAPPLSPGLSADPENEGSAEESATSPPASAKKVPWPVWKKVLVGAVALSPVAVFALWIAVHSIPWMGPLVANTLRATIGKENVTRLEEFVYSIEDKVNQKVKSGDKPKAYWKVPQKKPAAAPSEKPAAETLEGETQPTEDKLAPFDPPAPGPVHESWSAEGDGQWVPVTDPRRPDEEPRLFKTLLHPDSSRSWAELFVVAVDLRQVSVMPVMGYQEPRTDKKEAEGYTRHAKIPEKHYDALLAAFNGGFMAEHGGYGVYYNGVVFIDPKDDACTLAHYKNGSFQVASWSKIKDGFDDMLWYRQAPNCMYEEGVMHPNLKIHRARKWGATLDGNTVIRRSAVGLSKDGQILYVGISNHTTAKVMAAGMNHAGAQTVAQMDVNWSYPKFVTYEKCKDDKLYPIALADGFEFSDKLYLRERSMRDFFYLARKEEITPPQADAPPPNKDSAE